MKDIPLRYGLNPHQLDAMLRMPAGKAPLRVLNGNPGYINILDALTAWQLVRELNLLTGKTAAASYKHVSPAGAALPGSISAAFAQSQMLPFIPTGAAAQAYVRARGGDRMSSFGDAAAISGSVDRELAELLRGEVSDLIIAPDYEPGVVESLSAKKRGNYLILQMDPAYEPQGIEERDIFGFGLEQQRNVRRTGHDIFTTGPDARLPAEINESLVLATTTLKYTQSNSVCLAVDGQIIGIGAGQQSRIHCVRLACGKADKWMLQLHPQVLGLRFPADMGKPDRTNAIDRYILWNQLSAGERQGLVRTLGYEPVPLSDNERAEWIAGFDGICMSSDGFIPFRDNLDRAAASGVRFVSHPGGSARNASIREAAEEHGLVMFETGVRSFFH